SGPLYLFANNSNFNISPSGSLDVYIDNAMAKSYEEIESMLGWNLQNLNTTVGHDYLSEGEKLQFIFLNKVRSNPSLFAKQYLIHLIENGSFFKEVYEKLLNYPQSKLLKPSKALYLSARDHAKDLGENGTTG